jgi:hypothetical protein
MPTLDDLPILASLTPTGDDLLPIYDLTGSGSSKVRKVSLNQINGIGAGDFALTNVTTATAAVTVATKMVRITGTAGNTGLVTVTLPLPTGALRDIIVQFFTAGSGGSASVVVSGGGSTIFTSAAAAATNAVAIASGTTLRVLSDGTNWYRTH